MSHTSSQIAQKINDIVTPKINGEKVDFYKEYKKDSTFKNLEVYVDNFMIYYTAIVCIMGAMFIFPIALLFFITSIQCVLELFINAKVVITLIISSLTLILVLYGLYLNLQQVKYMKVYHKIKKNKTRTKTMRTYRIQKNILQIKRKINIYIKQKKIKKQITIFVFKSSFYFLI